MVLMIAVVVAWTTNNITFVYTAMLLRATNLRAERWRAINARHLNLRPSTTTIPQNNLVAFPARTLMTSSRTSVIAACKGPIASRATKGQSIGTKFPSTDPFDQK